mmetsp:Transcript_33543/g.79168  ORF Transcript_33543/g.79168 Transcript_33543/m.79168 type:complete len:939 (-) Transcript_33543:674-3490(-)
MSFVQRRPLPQTITPEKPQLRPGTSSSQPSSRPDTTASQAVTRPGTRSLDPQQELPESEPHDHFPRTSSAGGRGDFFPRAPSAVRSDHFVRAPSGGRGDLPPLSRPETWESVPLAGRGTLPSLLKREESRKRPPLGKGTSRKLLLFDKANDDGTTDSPTSKRFAKSQLKFDASFKRRKDRETLKEEARQAWLRRVAELSAQLPPRPTAQHLIAELGRGFPPVPLASDASGDRICPAPAPPKGWEETVRNTRHFRAAVGRKLEDFDVNRQRRAIRRMKLFVEDIHYWKQKFHQVRGGLFYCFSQVMTDTFVAWVELTKQLVVMRRKAKKIAIWLMNRETVRAWGAWLAVWAHGKDWRIFSLKGALTSRLKKATRFELETMLKSKRGKTLMRDLADMPMEEMLDRIIVTKVDMEALMSLTVDEYMLHKVFRSEDRDRAERLVWKMGRLMVEDTSRLDKLHIWKGSLLVNVEVYKDDLALRGARGRADPTGAETRAEAKEEEIEEEERDELETRMLQVDAHPSAAVESAWQTMMAGTESLLTNWGWGYILHLTKLPALLHGISSRLILQDTCIAFGYLVHVDQNKCIKMSEIVKGRSSEIEWYQFDFGDYPLSHGLALVIAMSDRGQQLAASASNRFCYTLDHHSNRAICRSMTVDPGSFDGRWNFTPAARCISMELQLVVDGTFDAEEQPEKGKRRDKLKDGADAGTAEEKVDDENEHIMTLVEALNDMRADRDEGRPVNLKQMDDLHVQLRKRVLDNTGEVLEPSLGYLDDRRLWLDIAVDCPCCFNPLMNEFWVLDSEKLGNFLICDVEGTFVREYELMTSTHLRVYFMSFDSIGDLFLATDNSTVMHFHPTKPLLSDHFFKLWHVTVPGGRSPVSVTTNAEEVFCLFLKGPLVTLAKQTGVVQRTIHVTSSSLGQPLLPSDSAFLIGCVVAFRILSV